MKILNLLYIILSLYYILSQQVVIDSIDFHDSRTFTQTILTNNNGIIEKIEYSEKNGILKKIELYNHSQQLVKSKVYNSKLIQDIEYTYFEKGQVIKRYEKISKTFLNPLLNVIIEYPPLAREYEIEGIVKTNLKYNESCILEGFTTLNQLGHGIDEEVEIKLKLMVKLSKKYSIIVPACHQKNEPFLIHFSLQ